ncbi:MAG: hypothetical protein V4714_16815 [Bacteroidota bacterium]
MTTKKKPESIQEAKERLSLEIEYIQSMEAVIIQTKELLQLVLAYPPENPTFYQKLKAMQDKHQKPLMNKRLLDMVSDN